MFPVIAVTSDADLGRAAFSGFLRRFRRVVLGMSAYAYQEAASLVLATLEMDYRNLSKFTRAAQEFAVYIASNDGSLINYGERYRAGERISSCLAESSVNAVISKRFAKRQQMQWTKRGAHLLLQTRTRALDGTLRSLFEEWYPGLANDNAAEAAQAEVA
jgi:hypothetical protein